MSIHTSPPGTPAPPATERPTSGGRGFRRLVAVLLMLSAVLTFSYTAISIYMATQLVHKPQIPLKATPASLGLQYKDVTFPGREDHLQLRGWFIPGVLPGGQLTSQRSIIMVHGTWQNRTDPAAGLLDLSGDLARHGFAILAFDMRGMGESPPAPLSFGVYEQRDVLGAVDFLRSGPLPYPELGHPRAIAGWGVSLGAATLLMAAAQEPAIHAVVADSAWADILPILEHGVPDSSHLPPPFTPGGLVAARALYGIDFYNDRPADFVANIAPRSIFFIHGSSDDIIPASNMGILAAAARTAPNANVQTWLVPGAKHAQSYHVEGKVYVDRLVAFYTAALGPDTSGS